MKDSKTKILAAASELFLEGGSRALSVRAISSMAGLSTIGIYSHFQGKQGILDALYIEGFEMVDRAMDILTEENHGKPAVMQAVRNYLQLATRHEAHYRLIFGETDDGFTPSDNARQIRMQAFNSLTRVVASLFPQQADKEKIQSTAIQIWALTHGYVSLNHHNIINLGDPSQWQENILSAVETVVDALVVSHNL